MMMCEYENDKITSLESLDAENEPLPKRYLNEDCNKQDKTSESDAKDELEYNASDESLKDLHVSTAENIYLLENNLFFKVSLIEKENTIVIFTITKIRKLMEVLSQTQSIENAEKIHQI
ncbi:MAG: hypothetical protein MHPSP_004887 [Paramarteilia canceri]